jgi:DNA polymerase
VPAEGKKFIVADFSAVEARVIAWLAGESWRLDVFASGGDIYCASAEQMFHVPVVKHGVNGHLRQKGKIAELALGYGGGVGALKAMGALEMGVPEDELQPLVTAWRNANPKICRLWRKVDKAVKDVVRTRGTVKLPIGAGSFAVNNSTLHSQLSTLDISFHSGMLFIRLPSGRSLVYVRPRLGLNRFGSESVLYQGLNAAKKWDLIESYGPKFVENIVQGISRDLLAESMLRLKWNGRDGSFRSAWNIVAHVHDEVIIEADPADSVEEVCRIMEECPPWANGLILRADGYECKTYRKD